MQSDEIRRSLNLSWKEGIPASVMLSFIDYYLIPFGLFLGATTRQIAALVAIPHLLAAFAQPMAVGVVRRVGSRLTVVVRGATLQAALFIPIALLAALPFPGRLAALTALIAGFRILGSLIGTAWGSLVSEYLPADQRGSYFGWRSKVVGIAGVGGVVFGGLLLTWVGRVSAASAFLLLFLIAGALRFCSASLLARMADRPISSPPGSDFTFLMFLQRFRESNFVRFALYVAGVTFAAQVAAPYFSVYVLRDLHWSYLRYMAVHLAAVASGLAAFPIWGRHADLVGNAQILKMSSLLIPWIPFLWLVSASPWYLTGVELFAGFAWGGFVLCSTNFIYDAVSAEKRIRCLGYFSLIQGMAIFCGSLLGGFLADRLPPVAGHRLLTLFVLSGTLRLAAHFLLSAGFREVREPARRIPSLQLFFSVVGIRPLVGRNMEWSAWAGGDPAPFPHHVLYRREMPC